MSEEIRIRQAKLYDVPAMARIERDSFGSPWSAEEITKDVTAGGNVYVAVAECGEEKAGYGEIRMIAGEAQIYNIAISPEFRREGIGEALLRHMIAKAEDDGCGTGNRFWLLRSDCLTAIHISKKAKTFENKMFSKVLVLQRGLEPRTPCLKGRCSTS